jgi:hypothetical protein
VISDEKVGAAVAAFPELRALADLKSAGWQFATATCDGEVIAIQGVYAWPDGWADAIGVRYVTDAQGVRVDHTGALVWKRDGSLTEVAYGLLELPAPGTRTAPRLAIGLAPPLWTPGGLS